MTLDMALVQSIAVKLVGGILVLVIGFPVANFIGKKIGELLEKQKFDLALRKFLKSFLINVLKVLVVMTAAQVMGADLAAFTAIIAAVSFAVGLAFQGSLANFAGGVLLLMLRPFTIGDLVIASGELGVVEEIGIIYTKLFSLDNKVIMLPNGPLVAGTITNFSAENTRRVDLVFGASYDAPVEKVKSAIMSVIDAHELVLRDPEPFVRLSEHNASSLDYTVRVWVKAPDYWTVHFDLLEQVKAKFDEENIEIPYNKLDVNLNQLNQ